VSRAPSPELRQAARLFVKIESPPEAQSVVLRKLSALEYRPKHSTPQEATVVKYRTTLTNSIVNDD